MIYKDDYVTLYNCDCLLFDGRANIIFADPPYGEDLSIYYNLLFNKCDNHLFLMTNERELIKACYNKIDCFSRLFAVDTVVPNLISNKAPMQQCDFIAEFRFSKTQFINNNECFSNLIKARKLRMKKNFSQNFDKEIGLFSLFFRHYANEKSIILDPFCGSGSSLIAARQNRLKIIGVEKSIESCKHIIDRLSQTEMTL